MKLTIVNPSCSWERHLIEVGDLELKLIINALEKKSATDRDREIISKMIHILKATYHNEP